MMITGQVFNIQKFSVNDGPGVRTTVFLKGCPLNCIWCHNPESKVLETQIFYNPKKCVECKRCEGVCSKKAHCFTEDGHFFDRSKCVRCGKCIEFCYADALEFIGATKTVSEVLKEVLRDRLFYKNSGGGLTVSGGEPMMQFEFLYELLREAKKEGLHICLETCGFAKSENYKEILEYVDIFLYDYKETDPVLHKKFTSVSNNSIIDNLKMLDDNGAKIILRCPIIPTLNDRADHFEGIAKISSSLKNIIEVDVEPYHPLVRGKSELLGEDYPLKKLEFPIDDDISDWIEQIQKNTKVMVKRA